MAKLVILLVDDDIDDQQFFLEAVNQIDPEIQCFTATDGISALEYLRTCESLPDFIFLDVNMPRMGGKKCLKEIKRQERLSQIPVVIYSTSRWEKDLGEMKTLGASDFLQKPVLFEGLC